MDGKVRMCLDFRDLNKACPKDDFPLPHIDVLVDNTVGSALMSFMDGFSGYKQIKKAPKDMTKTTFITEWEIYCYTVMSFGLKNVEATYQRMATALLHDMMHNEVEEYVNHMIVVDTIVYPPSIYVLDLEKSKNIFFFYEGP